MTGPPPLPPPSVEGFPSTASPPPPAPPTVSRPPRRRLRVAIAMLAVLAAAATGAAVTLVLVSRPPSSQSSRSGTQSAPGQSATAPSPPAPTLDPPNPSPGDFTDPEANFHAVWPEDFAPSPESAPFTIPGRTLAFIGWGEFGFAAESFDNVGYVTFPPAFDFKPGNAPLTVFIDGEAKFVSGTLVSIAYGTTGGFRSADAVIHVASTAQGATAYLAVRAILAGHTLFLIESSGDADPPADFAAFAGSFSVLKHAP